MGVIIPTPDPDDLLPYDAADWVNGEDPPVGASTDVAGALDSLEQAVASASRALIVHEDALQALASQASGVGPAALVHVQSAPSARWNVTTGFGRPPVVALYVAGRLEFTDVECPPPYAIASLIFPTPLAGIAVLT